MPTQHILPFLTACTIVLVIVILTYTLNLENLTITVFDYKLQPLKMEKMDGFI